MTQDVREELHRNSASLNAFVDKLGDTLAQKNGWRSINGAEAARFYLMQKHGWLPRDVMAMGYEELRFALHQELSDLTSI